MDNRPETKLLEAVADIAYTLGRMRRQLTQEDSRANIAAIISRARDFEAAHLTTQWDRDVDYINEIDKYTESLPFYRVDPVQIDLTSRDWAEIYAALTALRNSPTTDDDPEWRGHLDAIIETIGPDGETAAGAGVEPTI